MKLINLLISTLLVSVVFSSLLLRKVNKNKKTLAKSATKWLESMPKRVNQLNCDNCWANSITTLVTTKYNILNNIKGSAKRLSIQQVMDCVNDKAGKDVFGLSYTDESRINVGAGCKALDQNNAQYVVYIINTMISKYLTFVDYPVTQNWTDKSGSDGSFVPSNCVIEKTEKNNISFEGYKVEVNPLVASLSGQSDEDIESEIKEAVDKWGVILINVTTLPDPTKEIQKCDTKKSEFIHAMILYGYDEKYWYVRNSWDEDKPLKYEINKNDCGVETLGFYLKHEKTSKKRSSNK